MKVSTQKANLTIHAPCFRDHSTRRSDLLSDYNFSTTKCSGRRLTKASTEVLPELGLKGSSVPYLSIKFLPQQTKNLPFPSC